MNLIQIRSKSAGYIFNSLLQYSYYSIRNEKKKTGGKFIRCINTWFNNIHSSVDNLANTLCGYYKTTHIHTYIHTVTRTFHVYTIYKPDSITLTQASFTTIGYTLAGYTYVGLYTAKLQLTVLQTTN